MDDVAPAVRYPETPWRYLWWLVRSQRRRVLLGALLGTTWMVGLTIPPLLLSLAIDEGLRHRSSAAVWLWAGVLLAVGLAVAVLAILRHRTMTRIRIEAGLQTIEATAAQSVRLGASLQRKATAGEIATIGDGDAAAMGMSLTVTGPGVGAVVAYVVIGFALSRISPLLAVIILVGMPLLLLFLGPLLNRSRTRGNDYREAQGVLSNRIVDVISGLRVLNTLGGKSHFAKRSDEDATTVQTAGYRLAATASWIQAISVGLPALFLATVVWIAARLAAAGDMSIGELVAVYGYVAVTVVPISAFIEGAVDINRALVSARRAVDFLSIPPAPSGDEDVRDAGAPLSDPTSGVRVLPGQFAAMASADRGDAIAILDRLGGLNTSDERWGDQRLEKIETGVLRRRVLVLDDDAFVFGEPLQEAVFAGRPSGPSERQEVALASGIDEMVRGLELGWDTELVLRGTNLSGGQRQRVRLARALSVDPDVLLAMDPLSAVDAVTESEVAGRVFEARRGRTTLVATSSAAILGLADVVHFVDEGRVVASGTHTELAAGNDRYRALVSRGLADELPDSVSR